MSAAVSTPAHAARLRKAAIVICALTDEQAAKVLEYLEPDEVEALTDAIASIRDVDRLEEQRVCTEYLNGLRRAGAPGGTERARSLIQRAFPPEEAARHLARLEGDDAAGPFGFIADVGVPRVLPFLRDEHPQTLALICACVAPPVAAQIVTALPNPTQRDVLARIGAMEPVSAVTANAVSDSLERRVSTSATDARGGAPAVERILAAAGNAGAALRRLLEGEGDAPLPAKKKPGPPLQSVSLVELFERTPVSLRGSALATVPPEEFTRALRAAPPEMGKVLLRHLPDVRRALVLRAARALGPVKVSEAERALEVVREALRRAILAARGMRRGAAPTTKARPAR